LKKVISEGDGGQQNVHIKKKFKGCVGLDKKGGVFVFVKGKWNCGTDNLTSLAWPHRRENQKSSRIVRKVKVEKKKERVNHHRTTKVLRTRKGNSDAAKKGRWKEIPILTEEEQA